MRAGAVGIVQQDQNRKFLIEAVRQIHRGETWLNQNLFHRILGNGRPDGKRQANGLPAPDPDALTARELQVLRLIGEGLSNKDLAKRLHISDATVRHHLSSVYSKMGADDRVNVLIRAYEKGLIN